MVLYIKSKELHFGLICPWSDPEVNLCTSGNIGTVLNADIILSVSVVPEVSTPANDQFIKG